MPYLFLLLSLFGFKTGMASADTSDKLDFVFECISYVKNPQSGWSHKQFIFSTNVSSLPDKQACGNSKEECLDAGFNEFISYNELQGKYFNHPILIAKYCTYKEGLETFIETRVGVVPHLNEATLSMRVNGQDSYRIWTHKSLSLSSLVSSLDDIALNYRNNEDSYVTECTIIPKVLYHGEVPSLSYNQPFDKEITGCP